MEEQEEAEQEGAQEEADKETEEMKVVAEMMMAMVGGEPRTRENRIRHPPPPRTSPIGVQQT